MNSFNRSQVDVQFETGYTVQSFGLKWAMKGEEYYQINGKTVVLQPGDFLWINPGDNLVLENKVASEGVCINFHPDSFQNVLGMESGLVSKHFHPVIESIHVGNNHNNTWSDAKAVMEDIVHSLSGYSAAKQQGSLTDKERASRVLWSIDKMHEQLENPLTLGGLAQEAAMSRFHYIRCFKSFTGLSPKRYYQNIRMKKAKEMLESGVSIIEVASYTNFNDLPAFSNAFKKHFGVRPSACY